MPIDGALRSGDAIEYGGARYYVRRAGTATYLHATADLRAPHRRTASTAVLMRDARRVRSDDSEQPETTSEHVRSTSEHASTASEHVRSTSEHARSRASEHVNTTSERASERATRRRAEPRYVYVVRATDLPRTVRELKIGITHSVPERMRAYRQRNPSDEAIVVVDTGGAHARALERELHTEFAAFRVDRSEVFAVRAHEVRRALVARDYRAHDDGVYRKVFA